MRNETRAALAAYTAGIAKANGVTLAAMIAGARGPDQRRSVPHGTTSI